MPYDFSFSILSNVEHQNGDVKILWRVGYNAKKKENFLSWDPRSKSSFPRVSTKSKVQNSSIDSHDKTFLSALYNFCFTKFKQFEASSVFFIGRRNIFSSATALRELAPKLLLLRIRCTWSMHERASLIRIRWSAWQSTDTPRYARETRCFRSRSNVNICEYPARYQTTARGN